MTGWLIPWLERGRSGAVRDNLLWKNGRVYVMDNHRLALWCWWQHLGESEYWSYHHIDRHFDSLWQKFNPWPNHTTDEHRTDLDAFRAAQVRTGHGEVDLYRWDTITSALWSLHHQKLLEVSFATAGEGDHPAIPKAQHIGPWKLPAHLRYLAEAEEGMAWPRILDIDIDFFTHADLDGPYGQVFSDDYVSELGQSIRVGLDNDRFGVVTIALSPETTGSWPLAERLLETLLDPIGLATDFFSQAP